MGLYHPEQNGPKLENSLNYGGVVMLGELSKLNIINEGYKRDIFINKIYINPTHVVSVKDYDGAREFLISEGAMRYADQRFCLVKMSHGDKTEEIIALGTSEEVFKSVNGQIDPIPNKRLLNG